jgi:Protein of unknown function
MDKQQAVEIQEYLLEAATAIDLASAIACRLSREERETIAVPLLEIYSALHLKLLGMLYDQHPELALLGELPVVTTMLRWDDVVLPPTVSETEIDEVVFSVVTPRWQKIAMIVGKAAERDRTLALAINAETFGARVVALAEAGRIEAKGDIRKWRFSEVRLKG